MEFSKCTTFISNSHAEMLQILLTDIVITSGNIVITSGAFREKLYLFNI